MLKSFRISWTSVALLSAVGAHLHQLDSSIWFDEAAVIDNSSSFGLGGILSTPNWLQSNQPGFHVIVTLILEVPHGIALLKFLSLLIFFVGLTLFARMLQTLRVSPILTVAFIFLISFSDFALRYSTMVKPYVYDLLAVSIFVFAYFNQQPKLANVLLILAPIISITFLPISLTIAVLLILKNKSHTSLGVLAAVIVEGISFWLLSDSAIKALFRSIWFPSDATLSINNAKGSIYQVFGLIVEIFDTNERSILIRRIEVAIVILVLVTTQLLARSRMTENCSLYRAISIGTLSSTIVAATLHFFKLSPLALRLNSAVFVMILFSFVVGINSLGNKNLANVIGLAMIFAALHSISTFQPTENGAKEILDSHPIDFNSHVFTDIWNGPQANFLIKDKTGRRVHAVLARDLNGHIVICPQADVIPKPGDYLLVESKSTQVRNTSVDSNNLSLVQEKDGTALYKFSDDSVIKVSPLIQKEIFCRYKFENPNNPL